MSKKQTSISENLCHISTPAHSTTFSGIANQNTIRTRRVASPIDTCQQTIDCLVGKGNVYPYLVQMKQLLHFDIPLPSRLTIFAELNKILGALFVQYPTDRKIYNEAHAVMTLLNRQIDRKTQLDETLADQEWDELQKTVYLLCDWDDQIKSGNSVPAWKEAGK